MKIHLLFCCLYVLFLLGCDSLHYRQYVVKDVSLKDQETASVILANAAHIATLEDVTAESSMPKTLAYYEEKPEMRSGFKVWLGARIYNEDLVIDLSCFHPGWSSPRTYKSAEATLSQELPKVFGERLTIDPQPPVPFR